MSLAKEMQDFENRSADREVKLYTFIDQLNEAGWSCWNNKFYCNCHRGGGVIKFENLINGELIVDCFCCGAVLVFRE